MGNFIWSTADALSTGFHNKVVTSYLKNDNFPFHLTNTETHEALISGIVNHKNYSSGKRNVLADTILHQYSEMTGGLDPSSPVFGNVEKLRNENCVTVTTGQQIHIFLGPLFVIYKILSCIEHAKQLQASNEGIDVVPIFWMATEDHDFEEISTTRLYNETYTWQGKRGDAVGRLSPESLLSIVNEIKQRIDQTEENLSFLDLCEKAYSSHENFSTATRFIIHNLFEKHGLVILDPDDKSLKQLYIEDIKQDILQNSFASEIDKNIKEMKKFGFKAPINTRPINHFYLHNGSRNRIVQNKEGRYEFLGNSNSFSYHEIENEIEHQPERFSPNALLRPLYQQRILPNVIYVAGGSEFVYWLELNNLIQTADCIMPKVVVRNSVFIVGEQIAGKLESNGMASADLIQADEAFISKLTSKNNSEVAKARDLLENVEKDIRLLNAWIVKQKRLTLSNRFARSETAYINELKSLLNEYEITVTNNDQNLVKLLKLKRKIYGEDYIQERNDFIVNHIYTILNIVENSTYDTSSYFDSTKINTLQPI